MRTSVRRTFAALAASSLVAAGAVSLAGASSAIGVQPGPVVSSYLATTDSSAIYDLSWSAPPAVHDANYTLVGYESVLYTGAALTTVSAVSSTSSPKEGATDFGGLPLGQKYQGSVRAVYSVHQSSGPDLTEYSSYVDGDEVLALRPAPAVRSLHATASASGTITVSWTRPSVGSVQEGIGGYDVDVSPSFSDDFFSDDFQYVDIEKSVAAGKYSTKVRGLKPGTSYDVGVQTEGDGDSLFGLGGYDTTSVKAIGKPGKPSKLHASTLSGGRTKLTWKTPKGTKAGPVKGYKVYVNGHLRKTVTAKHHSYVVHGQKYGTSYTYSVRAYNKIGKGTAVTVSKRR